MPYDAPVSHFEAIAADYAVWALWHIVPWWIVLGRPIAWVAGQALATVAMRLAMGWIYACGGRSLFWAIVFHAMINTSFVLFPNNGSHYDPSVTAAVLMAMTALLGVTSGKLKLRFSNAGAI